MEETDQIQLAVDSVNGMQDMGTYDDQISI